MSHCFNVSIK